MSNLDRPFFTKKYLLICLLATIGYSLLFLSTFSMLADAAGTFLVFPILLVAWFCGLWRGVLYNFFILAWHVFLLVPIVGTTPAQSLTNWGFITAVFVQFSITALVGYLHDLRERIQQQMNTQAEAEKKIRALNETLETRVDQQTIELRESETRFRNLAQNSPDIIYVIDVVNRKTLYFNHQEFLDYTQEEFTDPAFLNRVLHPEDTEIVLTHWQNVITGKSPPQIEYRIKRKDGIWEWIQNRDVVLSTLQDGSPLTIMIILSVVTERKNIEVALRESEERWQFALEGSGDGVWDWDMLSGQVFFSPQWKKMLGYEASEIEDTHNSWQSLIHPEDLPFVQKEVDRHLQGETAVYTTEYRIKHKSGNYIWILARGKFLCNESGTAVRMIGTHTDITNRKLNEDTIYQIAKGVSATTSKQFFTSLVEYLGKNLQADTVFVGELKTNDSEPTIQTIAAYEDQHIAPNFEYDLANTPCQNVVGKKMCIYPKDVARKFPEDAALVANGIEGYIGVPLFSSNEQAIGIIVVLYKQPIKNSKIARSTIQIFAARAATELERTKAEIALRESENKLHQAQKMEAVGRLAGGVAHDFNNILTVIISYSDLLLRKLEPEEATYQHAQQIKDAGEKAAALTHQLLAFSRRQVLEPKILDLNHSISNISGMLRRLIDENIDIIFDLDDSIQSIKVDESQLELVLINLVINAKDAMPKGGKITVSTKRIQLKRNMLKDDDGEYLAPGLYAMLMISDTGTGIDTSILNRIFEPFFTTKERGKGTGLGLAMVHGFIKQSEGYIVVESEVELGTRFSLFFPVTGKNIRRKREEILPSASSGTETILLVEDDIEVRNITRDVLKLFGYKVIVSDAFEAIEMCQKNGRDQIHLLLTDIVMPQMNGRELATKISQYCPDLKTLYMSGYADSTTLNMSTLEKGSAFIQKPFSPQKIAQKVRTLLDE